MEKLLVAVFAVATTACATGSKGITREVTPVEARSAVRPVTIDAVVHDDGTWTKVPGDSRLAIDAPRVEASNMSPLDLAPSDRVIVRGAFRVGDTVPGGGVVSTHPNWLLVSGGALLTAGTVGIAVGLGAGTSDPNREWSFVPIIGPAAYAATFRQQCSSGFVCGVINGTERTVAVVGGVFLGIGQAAGIGLIVAGFTMPVLQVSKTTNVAIAIAPDGAGLTGRF